VSYTMQDFQRENIKNHLGVLSPDEVLNKKDSPVGWGKERTPTIIRRVGHVGVRSAHLQPTSCLDLSNRQHTFYPIKGFPSYIQKGDLFTYKREVF